MGSYQVSRVAFLGRALGTAQSVRTAVIIGDGVAAPANAEAVSDLTLTEMEEIAFIYKTTFAYTGGATDPTFLLRLQHKIADDLDDDDDAAWEDFGSFTSINVGLEEIMRLGAFAGSMTAGQSSAPLTAVLRDAQTPGQCKTGHPGHKIRVRETISGGDRTGGSMTYDLRILGIGVK